MGGVSLVYPRTLAAFLSLEIAEAVDFQLFFPQCFAARHCRTSCTSCASGLRTATPTASCTGMAQGFTLCSLLMPFSVAPVTYVMCWLLLDSSL